MTSGLRDPNDAAHEAAHAAVGCYLGLRCLGVRVTSSAPDEKGWAWFRCPATKRMAFGCMLAAGPEGDRLRGFRGHAGWSGDLGMLRDHGFLPGEVRMLRDLASAYLAGPLAGKWQRMTEVLCHRDLTGAEVRAFVVHGTPLELDA